MPAKTTKTAAPTTDDTSDRLSEEERAAIKDRAQELKAKRRGGRASKEDGESAVLAKIAELPEPDRAMAERLHAVVKASAPELTPMLWYGMPSYGKNGKVVCFFQHAQKFKARYATLGFSDEAKLDDGTMWPTSYALTELSASDEAQIAALVKRAVG